MTGTKVTKPRKAAAKPAAVRKTAAKPVAAAETATVPVKGGTLRKKDLIDRVVQVSGAKKKEHAGSSRRCWPFWAMRWQRVRRWPCRPSGGRG